MSRLSGSGSERRTPMWRAFLLGSPQRCLATATGALFTLIAVIPGLGGYLGKNLAGFFAPLGSIVQLLMVLLVILFGFRVMFFGWPGRGGRRGGGGGGAHP